MSSILKVDEIQDTSGNNIINENADTITIGKSGDTTNIVGTLQNNGSAVTSYSDSDALSLFNASGSAPVYACRAWVNFNGTGTVAIRDSGNVSSITDNGVGVYTVNFTTNMPDANYSAVATAGAISNVELNMTATVHAPAVGSYIVRTRNANQATQSDRNLVTSAVFR